MKNPFRKSPKKRGLPDSVFHAGSPSSQHQNNDAAMIPVAPTAPPAHSPSYSASSGVVPSGYPYNSSYPQYNHQPPTAYPHAAQPGKDESTRRVVEQDIRSNESKEGQQMGNFRLQKTVADTLAKGGGVSQSFVGNRNDQGCQRIGNFETYD